jgi:hypothetical protein
LVTEILEDMRYGGKVFARKGDVTCTVVERIEDLPHVDERTWRDRLWIHVKDCEPLQAQGPSKSDEPLAKEAGRSFRLMIPSRWADLSEHERSIYTIGALETWSFVLYGHSDPEQARGDLSDFVACVKGESIDRFTTALWIFGDIQKSVAEHIFDVTPMVCGKYSGKGDRSGRPLKILSRSQWGSFQLKTKEIYLIAYVEMAYQLEKVVSSRGETGAENGAGRNLRALENCLASVGIQGVLSQVVGDETKFFEWQYPLPWSISKSLGRECKKYR